MAIAIESVLFLLGGVLLAVVLWYAIGRPSRPQKPAGAPAVTLVRIPRRADGREETFLTVNDAVILSVSNEGVRLSEFADQLEQLEAIATRLAASLGVNVEFARASAIPPDAQAGVSMSDLPPISDEEIEEIATRFRAEASNRSENTGR